MAPRRPTPLRRNLQRFLLVLLGVVLMSYPADWLCWRVLALTGHGMGTAEITEMTAATLKGNHFEVYSDSKTTVPCSHSLLPEAGAGPCWWLHAHPAVVTQY